MGCAGSTDTGTQYASLGHHGQQNTKAQDNNTQRQTTLQTQQQQQTTPQQQTQQQQQQTQQQQQQQQTTNNDPPPPYENKAAAPVIVATPKSTPQARPQSEKTKDVQSGYGAPCINEATLDFRTDKQDFQFFDRPSIDGEKYTDYDFTVDVAFQRRGDLQWKRPDEIDPETITNPQLFTEDSSRFDVGQGEVGTCWFLAMLSNLAEHRDLLNRVIADDGWDRDAGIVHCKFWRFGQWIDTYIDDYLPVVYETQIAGAHSSTDPNEMWVAFLEKAFAKLYGSYDEVTGGLTTDSYLNLTGGVAELIEFKKRKRTVHALYDRIHNAFQCPLTMVGCSVPNENDGKCGLVGGHAYSMTGAVMAGDARLVRIRNPWGKGEWTGPWCDGSPEWDTVDSGVVPPPQKDDGEFYMEFGDFMAYFDDVTICNLTPDFDRDGNPNTLDHITNIYGNWREGKMGGFQNRAQNPLYCISVGDEEMDPEGKVPIVVQIIQRQDDRDDLEAIRCDLFKVLSRSDQSISLELMGDKSNMYLEHLQMSYRFRVEPGSYVIIPSTINGGVEKEFLIRVFTAGPISAEEVDVPYVMTGRGRAGEEPGDDSSLRHTVGASTRFVPGVNAGGQISCPTFGQNPGYLLDIQEEQALRIEMMQPDQEGGGFAMGFKLWEVSPEMFDNIEQWPIENYERCCKDDKGEDGPFQYGGSTDDCYHVRPGQHFLLLHCDSVNDQNEVSFAVYSERPIQIQGSFHTEC